MADFSVIDGRTYLLKNLYSSFVEILKKSLYSNYQIMPNGHEKSINLYYYLPFTIYKIRICFYTLIFCGRNIRI